MIFFKHNKKIYVQRFRAGTIALCFSYARNLTHKQHLQEATMDDKVTFTGSQGLHLIKKTKQSDETLEKTTVVVKLC